MCKLKWNNSWPPHLQRRHTGRTPLQGLVDIGRLVLFVVHGRLHLMVDLLERFLDTDHALLRGYTTKVLIICLRRSE